MTDAPDPAPAQTQEVEEIEEAPARAGHTARDMVISLVVLLIPVAIIVFFVWARGGDDVVNIDPGPAIAEAQVARAFPVGVPTGLSADWHPVSAQYTTADSTLRIGYVTPAGGAIQLIESKSPVDGLLIQELGDDVRPDGVVNVGTTAWNVYQLHNGHRAIVLPQKGRTVIIMGSAAAAELQELADSLK